MKIEFSGVEAKDESTLALLAKVDDGQAGKIVDIIKFVIGLHGKKITLSDVIKLLILLGLISL